jgi:hypothetical protein
MFEISRSEVFDPADRATHPEGGDICLVVIVPRNHRAFGSDLFAEGKMTLAAFSEGDPDYENDQAFFDIFNEEIKEAPEGCVLVYSVIATNCVGFWVGQRDLEDRRDRAKTQLTLGELIGLLEAMPAESQVANLQAPHSYHGIFADLAFEQEPGTRPAAELLALCKEILGRDFFNRGGEYEMWKDAPLWIAERGRTGVKLKAIAPGGGIETEYAEGHKTRS